MQLSALSARTGVAIPTLKYYRREGLLPPGEPVSATRAHYDETHVERVRLIRALVQGAGLSITAVRAVTEALDSPPASRHELYGIAQRALPVPGADRPVRHEVRELVATLGWRVTDDAPALRSLGDALDAARSGGIPMTPEVLERYARSCHPVAELDVEQVRAAESPSAALTTVVVGTVLTDPVLSALRRLAQEDVSARTADPRG